MDERTFDRTVSGFYQAASGTLSWGAALRPLQERYRAKLVTMYAVDTALGSVVFSHEVGEVSAAAQLDYLRHYHRIDPRARVGMQMGAGVWVNDWEHFDDDFVAQDPF